MIKKLIIIVIVILLANLSGCLNNNGNNVDYSKGDLELYVVSTKSILYFNEDTLIRVILENIGNTTIKTQQMIEGGNFNMSIINSSGYDYYYAYPVDMARITEEDLITLSPNENISLIFNLQQFEVPLNRSESFTLKADYIASKNALSTDALNSWTGHLYSDEIVIEVLE